MCVIHSSCPAVLKSCEHAIESGLVHCFLTVRDIMYLCRMSFLGNKQEVRRVFV